MRRSPRAEIELRQALARRGAGNSRHHLMIEAAEALRRRRAPRQLWDELTDTEPRFRSANRIYRKTGQCPRPVDTGRIGCSKRAGAVKLRILKLLKSS